MSPGATEALFAIGAGARIVGRSPRCDFPDEALSIPLIAEESSGLIAAAALVSAKPDLVIVDAPGTKLIVGLQEAGFAVFVYDPRNFQDLAESIMALGKLVGEKDASIRAAARLTAAVRHVRMITEGMPSYRNPKVFWEAEANPLETCGTDSFFHGLIGAAGGRNVFADGSGSAIKVDMSEITVRAPEFIVIAWSSGATPGGLSEQEAKAWVDTPAVRTGRIVRLAPGLGSRIGPRSAYALLAMARAFHPDVFP
jgi:iron complex transport system substrate-binding protein